MKQQVISSVVLLIMCFSLIALKNDEPNDNQGDNRISSMKLDANNISTWFRNNGSFNRDPATGNSGFEWPKGSAKFARYASGLWIGAKVGNDTLICLAEYDYEYLPGYIDNNGDPQGSNDTNFRVYRIERGDTLSSDYLNWPINQGAYVNSLGRPFFLGTQTMFYSYTDGYPLAHNHNAGGTAPLKAQILQTNWSYSNIGLSDFAFTEFRVINRSSTVWNNAYIAFWTDDDLGSAADDAMACDTVRDLTYTYNFTVTDPIYGIAPPAVGTKVLRSPITFTGNNSDTVKYYSPPGTQNLKIKIGYKYIGLPICNVYTQDPSNYVQTYNLLQGLMRLGQTWINPITGQITKKVYSGDPVSGTGWIMSDGNDLKFLQSFGPITMAPNDTQSIIVAQVIARGSSNLNSITLLRDLSDYVQTIYNQNFQSVLSVNNISTVIPERFNLYQNYPNPFNPTTKIKFDIAGHNKKLVKITIYDLLGREVKQLVNDLLNPGNYEIEWNASEFPSGVYFYKIESGTFISTKKMLLLK